MIYKLKDPGSAITHFIGMLFAVIAAGPLVEKAAQSDVVHIVSLTIFIVSMILLYLASTVYHSFNINEKKNQLLRKIDHMMISVLIAGSYTPICLIVLGGKLGWSLFGLIWGIALVGIIINAFWITCPKWFSSMLYIAMGWVCVMVFAKLLQALSADAFGWLLAGGIVYTIGGVIYALKLPIFNKKFRNFGSHEIFHLFVMGGSFCHFITMYKFVAIMPI